MGEELQTVLAELEAGIALAKCRQCGCMAGALENLGAVLPAMGDKGAALAATVTAAQERMRPVRYDCLGCEHCYPAVAQNAFAQAFPALSETAAGLSCEFRVDPGWPPVVGEYAVVDPASPVAVSTLASVELTAALAARRPPGLAIAGKTETENIGIDKVVKNVISNPALRYLIVAGREAKGHLTGQTLLALAANGVDGGGRVIGSPGKRPVLRNVSMAEVEAFRAQMAVIDLIGCTDVDEIAAVVAQLAAQRGDACGCGGTCGGDSIPIATISAPGTLPSAIALPTATPRIFAAEPGRDIPLDKAGYFVIIPLPAQGVINVEHYAYDNELLRVVEGATARAIYHALVANGWVTDLSHAAYLGKELARAELALQGDYAYVQDGA